MFSKLKIYQTLNTEYFVNIGKILASADGAGATKDTVSSDATADKQMS